MALPIKPTPNLCGEEAINFEKSANENEGKTASSKEFKDNCDLFINVMKNSDAFK